MKKTIALLALIFAAAASAETIEYKTLYVNDDGVITRKNSASVLKAPLGVGVSYATHATPFGKVDSKEASLLLDYNFSGGSVFGSLGVGELEGRSYFVGDTSIRFSPVKDVIAEVTVFGDTIISNASPVKTPYYGVMANTEFSNNGMGIVVGTRSIRYTDNNTQNGYHMRVWASIADGVVVFAKYRGYSNSLPFSPNYFSPDKYHRGGFGVTVRHRIGDTRLSATAENAKINSAGNSEDVVAWKLQTDTKLSKSTSFVISAGKDYGLSGGFEYRYAEVKLKMEF